MNSSSCQPAGQSNRNSLLLSRTFEEHNPTAYESNNKARDGNPEANKSGLNTKIQVAVFCMGKNSFVSRRHVGFGNRSMTSDACSKNGKVINCLHCCLPYLTPSSEVSVFGITEYGTEFSPDGIQACIDAIHSMNGQSRSDEQKHTEAGAGYFWCNTSALQKHSCRYKSNCCKAHGATAGE